MASRVKPDEIVGMNQLYNNYGNYADVACEVGRSRSTVARYVKMKETSKIVAHTFKETMRNQ